MHRSAHKLFQPFVVLALALLAAAAPAQVLTTIAGGGPNDAAALSAPVGEPWAVARDQAGNTYISDNLSSRIFKVDANSNLTVFAGNIVSNYTGDGGAPTAAAICRPEGIVVDASGNVFFADTGDNVIRVVNTQASAITVAGVTIQPGTIQTVAGNGLRGYAGDGGPATLAKLKNPGGVFIDHSGNMFIADTLNSVIRKVTASGTISTVAGNFGLGAGFSGDGGLATSAQLNGAADVYLDSAGNLYIADTLNNRVRAVNMQPAAVTIAGITIQPGDIQTIAGNGIAGYGGDGGPATSAEINGPQSVLVGGGDNIFIADSSNNLVREVSTSGDISTFAGNFNMGPGYSGNGGPASNAQLSFPTGLSADSAGDLFIADQNNSAIREVMASNGDILTDAGIVQNLAYFGDGGVASASELFSAAGVASDGSGNIYIADTRNSRIRVVNTQSSPITVAGVVIAPGQIATVAGTGVLCVAAPCGDGGAALNAQLSFPADLAVDASGNIFFAEYQPSSSAFPVSVVREVLAATGQIQTVAGSLSKGPGYSGDGGAASSAQLNQAFGISLDKSGNLFIADTGNNVIRGVNMQSVAVSLAGVTVQPGRIATIAGNGTQCASPTATCGDGGQALSAQFNLPTSVTLDRSGNLYIADSNDNRIREVVAKTGAIEAYAGTGVLCTTVSCGDGGAATAAEFSAPLHVLADYQGDVFIADTQDYVIREVTASNGVIQTVAGNATRGFSGDNGAAVSGQLDNVDGLAGDAAGNLLMADFGSWRVRRVSGIVATAPTADLSTNALNFADQTVGTLSDAQTVTLSNEGNLTALQVSSIVFSGPQAGDFAESDNCLPSVSGHGSCSINVTFKPLAAGTRSATMTITDDASGTTQSVNLSGTGMSVLSQPGFTLAAGALSAVNPGHSTSATVTINSVNGFSSAVALTCSVSPTPKLAPTCSFSKNSVTPAGNGSATSVLTVSTTGPTAALDMAHPASAIYAMWLLLPAMLLGTAGMGTVSRRKMLSYFLIGLALMGCLLLVACGAGSSQPNGGSGGGSGGSGGGSGSSGTPAGQYTVTVTGTAGSNVQTQKLVLTVE